MNKYQVVKLIGHGAEGKAMLCKKLENQQLYVVKQRVFSTLDQANEGLNEAMSLAKINHPNIVKFEEVFIHNNNGLNHCLCIVMQYCDGGDLMDFLVDLMLGENKSGNGGSSGGSGNNSILPLSPSSLFANNSIYHDTIENDYEDYDWAETSTNTTSYASLTVSTTSSASNISSLLTSPILKPQDSPQIQHHTINNNVQIVAQPSIYNNNNSNNNTNNNNGNNNTTPSNTSSSSTTSTSSSNNNNSSINSINISESTTPPPPIFVSTNILNRSDDVTMTHPCILKNSSTESTPVMGHKKKKNSGSFSWLKNHRKAKSRDSAFESSSINNNKSNSLYPPVNQSFRIPTSPPMVSETKVMRRNQLPKKLLYNWIYQLCLGVQAIHSNHLIHRDLKTQNIFLSNYQIKIGDFGLAQTCEGSVTGLAGTYCYSSPETLNNTPYSRPADIFSLGCIIYEMTTLHLLPYQKRYLAEEILAGTFDPKRFLREFPIEFFHVGELVVQMLDVQPQQRPTIDLILQHKIFDRFKAINSSITNLTATLSPEISSSSTFSVSPLGGFRKQLDRIDLHNASIILSEAYAQDPRFTWIKKSNSQIKQEQQQQNETSTESSSNTSTPTISQTANNITTPPTSPPAITSGIGSKNELKSKMIIFQNNNDYQLINQQHQTTIVPLESPKKESRFEETFLIRKAFFDSALKMMFVERFILWGYYNSENILKGVACWISPEMKKRVPFKYMLLKILYLLPKLGLKASKRIKILMDVIDKAMEISTNDDGGQHYHLAYCGVTKECRSKGIGQYLIAPILEWCDFSNKKCKTIVLKQRSIPFFMRLGFEMTHEIKDSLPKGMDQIWIMERKPKPKV